MKFVIHFVGEWTKDSDWKTPYLTESWIQEYDSLDQMSEHDRLKFESMLREETWVSNSGSYIWSIKKC